MDDINVLVITDNNFIYKEFLRIIGEKNYNNVNFHFVCSKVSPPSPLEKEGLNAVRLNDMMDEIKESYQLIISLHCKQIFSKEVLQSVRCINVHPGYNPYNRGWYPQVFSIMNKYPVGVTIHEIDEQLDHGLIIVRERVPIKSSDTSYDIYLRILNKEIELLTKHLEDIIHNRYTMIEPEGEGNINYKEDFNKLCEFNLSEQTTTGDIINRLRALTFNGYNNAYFIDETGQKIFMEIRLKTDESPSSSTGGGAIRKESGR